MVAVLTALRNASVVTDPKNPQVVNNGAPEDTTLFGTLSDERIGLSFSK